MATMNIDLENLKFFGFWGSILVLKIIAMSLLTSFQRFRKRVFSNEEDTVLRKQATVSYSDPDVERVRRAHLNDLENVLPWFLATWFWLGTGPSTNLVAWLIRTFVVSRIAHTIVYAVFPLPQPTRAIVFFVGYFITGYMAVASLLHYYF